MREQHRAKAQGAWKSPQKLKAPAGPKAASARQPSPRTAFERENIVSHRRCKDLSSNLVVIAKSYPEIGLYLAQTSGLNFEVCKQRQMI